MTGTASPSRADVPLTFGRLVVLVHDYDAALAFYQQAFGARVLFDAASPSGDRYLHIALAGNTPPEGENAPGVGFWLLRASGPEAERVGRQTGGQPMAVLYTPDVRGAVLRVEAAGGAVVRPLATAGGASFAHVGDLHGNEFVLVELSSAPS